MSLPASASASLSAPRLRPIILAGGGGTRLWPLSRPDWPKQLLCLNGGQSLLQQTLLRVADPTRFEAPILVTAEDHAAPVALQLAELDLPPVDRLLEPAPRNTAPAVAVATLHALDKDPDAVLLVLPADHAIAAPERFADVLATAARAAVDRLVLIGVRADHANTGYGYIRAGMPDQSGLRVVADFIEKPDRQTAESLIAGGDALWNSGMVLAPGHLLLAAFQRLAPEVLATARAALDGAQGSGGEFHLDRRPFEACPAGAFDRVILERLSDALVVPGSFGWSDVGAWSAVSSLAPADSDGNALIGPVLAQDCRSTYLRSEGPVIAAIGVEDLTIIATPNAVLVADNSKAEDVGGVAWLATAGCETRPWGRFDRVDQAPSFQVKRLTVAPGKRLSLQRHAHRDEHWVVVSGVAEATVGQDSCRLAAGQSVFIPRGALHRLGNPSGQPLEVIEVQNGLRLDEDDIERLADDFGRAP